MTRFFEQNICYSFNWRTVTLLRDIDNVIRLVVRGNKIFKIFLMFDKLQILWLQNSL